MQKKVRAFITNPKSKDIIINSFGNYLNVFFAFGFQLIFVRIFSPAEYGVLSVLLGIAYLMATILDFGTTATIYSYLPKHLETKGKELYQFLKSIFTYQSVLAGIVVSILAIIFPYLDTIFFKTEAAYIELFMTAVAIMFFIWQNFFLNIHFAAKQFLKTNILLNLSNIVKTAAIGLLYMTDSVSISSVLFVLGFVGVSSFLISLLIDKRKHLSEVWKSSARKEDLRFQYTFTFFIATQFLNFGMRLDLFVVSFFSGILTTITKNDVGYYGLAQRIVLVVVTLIISITQVLSPSFAAVKSRKQAVHELWHGLLYIMMPVTVFIVLALTPGWVFDFFFTKDFTQAARYAHILSLPYILFAISNIPMLFLLYTVKKPKYILIAHVTFFLINAAGCFLLIPQFGVIGAPYAVGIGFIVATGLLAVPAYKEVHKLPKRVSKS